MGKLGLEIELTHIQLKNAPENKAYLFTLKRGENKIADVVVDGQDSGCPHMEMVTIPTNNMTLFKNILHVANIMKKTPKIQKNLADWLAKLNENLTNDMRSTAYHACAGSTDLSKIGTIHITGTGSCNVQTNMDMRLANSCINSDFNMGLFGELNPVCVQLANQITTDLGIRDTQICGMLFLSFYCLRQLGNEKDTLQMPVLISRADFDNMDRRKEIEEEYFTKGAKYKANKAVLVKCPQAGMLTDIIKSSNENLNALYNKLKEDRSPLTKVLKDVVPATHVKKFEDAFIDNFHNTLSGSNQFYYFDARLTNLLPPHDGCVVLEIRNPDHKINLVLKDMVLKTWGSVELDTKSPNLAPFFEGWK